MSSLLWLRDADSCYSRGSIASESSKLLDRIFDFDREIFTSRVYQGAMRSNMNKMVHHKRMSSQPTELPVCISTETVEPMPDDKDGQVAQTVRQKPNFSRPILTYPEELQQPSDAKVKGKKALMQGNTTSAFQDDRQALWHQKQLPSLPPSALSLSTRKRNIKLPNLGLAAIPELPQGIVHIHTSTTIETEATKTIGDGYPVSNEKHRAHGRFRSMSGLLSPRLAPITSQGIQRGEPREAWVSKVNETNRHSRNENRKTPKILVLGSSMTGKSTGLKSMKLLSEGSYARAERKLFKDIIFSETIQSMRVILEAMEKLELHLEDLDNERHVVTIFMQPACMDIDIVPPDIGPAIEALWNDSGVQECFKRSSEYHLNDNAQ